MKTFESVEHAELIVPFQAIFWKTTKQMPISNQILEPTNQFILVINQLDVQNFVLQ